MVSPLGEEATTSQSASFNEEASTSQSPVDSDALYASWLFEEINRSPLSSDLECEEANDDLAIKYSPKADLTEIIAQLACSINLEKISKFNIIRSNVWEGAVRGLFRKSFAPESKVSVKFCDDLGAAEGAIDHGGPKREFFTLVLDAIINSQIFCGSENAKFLSCNANCQTNDYYFYAGEIIALSLVHGGPGFRYLAPVVYDSIVYGTRSVSVDINDVYDLELKTSLLRITKCKSVDEAKNLINDPAIETTLDLADTLQHITSVDDAIRMAEDTAHWFLLGRVNYSLERFKEGLTVLGVLQSITVNPEAFRPVFCFSPQIIDCDLFSSLFVIIRSEKGLNVYQKESLVLSYWSDYLQDIDDGGSAVSFSDILFFSSGCKEIPPLGLKLTMRFLHTAEKDGSMSQFPKANTCACVLSLPTIHKEFKQFKEALTFAFLNAKGFGEP